MVHTQSLRFTMRFQRNVFALCIHFCRPLNLLRCSLCLQRNPNAGKLEQTDEIAWYLIIIIRTPCWISVACMSGHIWPQHASNNTHTYIMQCLLPYSCFVSYLALIISLYNVSASLTYHTHRGEIAYHAGSRCLLRELVSLCAALCHVYYVHTSSSNKEKIHGGIVTSILRHTRGILSHPSVILKLLLCNFGNFDQKMHRRNVFTMPYWIRNSTVHLIKKVSWYDYSIGMANYLHQED